jgi:hypothetical protein
MINIDDVLQNSDEEVIVENDQEELTNQRKEVSDGEVDEG